MADVYDRAAVQKYGSDARVSGTDGAAAADARSNLCRTCQTVRAKYAPPEHMEQITERRARLLRKIQTQNGGNKYGLFG